MMSRSDMSRQVKPGLGNKNDDVNESIDSAQEEADENPAQEAAEGSEASAGPDRARKGRAGPVSGGEGTGRGAIMAGGDQEMNRNTMSNPGSGSGCKYKNTI